MGCTLACVLPPLLPSSALPHLRTHPCSACALTCDTAPHEGSSALLSTLHAVQSSPWSCPQLAWVEALVHLIHYSLWTAGLGKQFRAAT